ncbi:MAG: hypothetical protein FWG12_05325 [Holophagaceae bacterium]|nr:hypothetical protein [Holophagaceae bacterium]
MSIRHLVGLALLFSIGNLGQHGLGAQESRAIFQFQNDAVPNLQGILFYNKNRVARAEIAVVADNRRLVGWGPFVTDFETPPANAQIPNLSRHRGDAWAFYYLGNLIASGNDKPALEDLENAYLRAGVSNRVYSLRQFLRRSPTNLDGRLELMKELEKHARQKTSLALNIALRSVRDNPSLSGGSTLAPQISQELDAESDENIWGELVALFNASFVSGNWLSVLPGFFGRLQIDNMALYSPAMKALYKKNLPLVENELEDRQADLGLWRMWQEMAQATGRKILDFFPQLPQLPDESGIVWPPIQVSDWMREEARLQNDWPKIIELDWPRWGGITLSLDIGPAPVGRMPDAGNPTHAMARERLWVRNIFPLLEACLHGKDFDKANEIFFDIASRPAMEREARAAVDMARAHDYIFPQTFESQRSRPEVRLDSFLGDPVVGNRVRSTFNQPNRLRDLPETKGIVRLAIIELPAQEIEKGQANIPNNPTNNSQTGGQASADSAMLFRQQLQRILSRGGLEEYRFFPLLWKTDEPVARELIEREGLPDNAYTWGILGENNKYYHGGHSVPTTGAIFDLIKSANIKTLPTIFKEFATEHPDSVTAGVILLGAYLGDGTRKTQSAEWDENGHLGDSNDLDIWADYVRLANTMLPRILERPQILFPFSPLNNTAIKNSRLLKQFASRQIVSIEEALQGRPHSRELWELWSILSPHAQTRTPSAFLDALSPVPGLPGFPPTFLYPSLIENYKSLEAWGRIISLVEPIWESYQNMADAEESIKHRLNENLWHEYIGPLCEAYETLGEGHKAEKIRATWKKAEGWEDK